MRITKRQLFSVVSAFFVAVFLCTSIASAHVLPLGTINTELNIHGERIDLYTTTSQNVIILGYPREELHLLYEQEFKNNFGISIHNAFCTFVLDWFDASPEVPRSSFRGHFTCPEPVDDIWELKMFSAVFEQEFSTFDHFTTVFIHGQRYEILFNQNYQNYPDEVIAKPLGSEISYFFTVAGNFIWLGMMHIFTGYDHILFLLSIVLLGRSVWKLVKIITAFTVAHSITLTLAALNIVHISPHIVEPAIALTIAYVAYRNIMELRSGSDAEGNSERWMLAFSFGLIHGLGFAAALSQTQIPHIFFLPSLLSFNIGIEIGQLCILIAVLPVLFIADTWRYRKILFIVLSSVIFLLAVSWFGIRVLVGESCAKIISTKLSDILCI